MTLKNGGAQQGPVDIVDKSRLTVQELMREGILADIRRMRDEGTGLNTPEPAPVGNDSRSIWDLVIEDMRERDRNGRKPLVDAYQEALNLTVYLRQEIEERQTQAATIERLEQELADARQENSQMTQTWQWGATKRLEQWMAAKKWEQVMTLIPYGESTEFKFDLGPACGVGDTIDEAIHAALDAVEAEQ